MSANDTRSIGQVLFEKLRPCGDRPWSAVHPADKDGYERAAEVIFKRGHDARGKEERALTPKAKQYRDALVKAYAVLRLYRPEIIGVGASLDHERLRVVRGEAEEIIAKVEGLLR